MLSSGNEASEAAEHIAARDRGASLVEYALLVALIALVCFIAVVFLGTSSSESFDSNTSSLFDT